ncbi:polysaccharide biosynthesis/export family protein [Roseimaritima ulvae]|uniref:Polysaccharide biosynthesis/export protein n=1 Tax=Roseimaritima ulvae TaxID=980254 RepID=A0A5B9R2U8_9BACT|nr:polysaccharide biosynthesis/export family protein [Roseimaritima ulvae]QEG43776.1 Polysaccharide biosynthesis/export protein [Roseimaritima ulvae]
MIRTLFASACLLALTGCSSLGISLYPTGHFLTPESEAVLEQAPSPVELPRELNLSVVPVHHLQPGDVLLIEPVQFNDNVRLPADQQVLSDGTIDLGGFGRLQVAGMTLEEAESSIEQRLVAMEAESAQVNVRLLNGVERYYVLGEVQSPGAYPLVGNETVLDGILQAGGLTDLAAPCKILLARPTPPPSCRVVLPICYRQLTQLGDTSTNYQLQPGDRIYVASRSCVEELMFWRANRTCQRCCGCQRACCHPEVVEPGNPVSVVLPVPPSLPNWSQDPELDAAGPLRMQDGLIESVPQQQLPPAEQSPWDGELDFESPLG